MANITGDSVEAVAFALLEQAVWAEGNFKYMPQGGISWTLTAEEILDRYSQCLACVSGRTGWRGISAPKGNPPTP